MDIHQDPLNAHDYNKKMHALRRRSSALRRKSAKIMARLDETFKKCMLFLQPENKQK